MLQNEQKIPLKLHNVKKLKFIRKTNSKYKKATRCSMFTCMVQQHQQNLGVISESDSLANNLEKIVTCCLMTDEFIFSRENSERQYLTTDLQ